MGSLLQTGKASIDLAATSTVEGVDAMSRVMSINEGQGLQRDIKVDVMGRQRFFALGTLAVHTVFPQPSRQSLFKAT